MNRKFQWFTAVSCAIVALSVCTACQDDDMSQQPTDPATSVHTYRIVADVDAAPDGEGTRALTEDASSVIHSAWLQNDKMIAYCLNDKDKSPEANYNLLQSANAGKGSKFDGTFKAMNAITTNDDICFFYPGAASVGEEATITSAMRKTGDGKKAPLVYYEQQPTIKQTVELDLTEQDGTAETIGKKFDYQWAKAKPSAVNGTDVTVKSVNMQRLIAIWGLRFANSEGILTNIDEVYISGVKALDVLDLGTGQFVDDNINDENDNIVLKPANNGKLTSADGKYTYAAILPGTYAKVLIIVFVGDKCYAREYTNITLDANKVYRTDVINMEQVNDKPYVEVQGVKWATGNFIHYGVEGSGTDYWGIAPTQWWISQYHMWDANNQLYICSQFYSDGLKSIPEDLDLFRYGDITEPTNVKAGHFKQGSIDISKKLYAHYGPLKPEIEYGPDVKYGDIVWYYTHDDNQKYRMPKDTELKLLIEKANVIPGYCYSDKGLRVYGAFFYTNNGEPRKKTFPTRVNALQKYNNVTALVRANKGLFLPVTGRRNVDVALIGYRDMTYGAGAYGQYMSSTSGSSMLSSDAFFGPTEWNFSPNGKGQAKAIRPVWDESSSTTPNPVYPAFKDIN